MFSTGKRLTHPTWRYKSRKNYVIAKEREFSELVNALYKLKNGSAWLPKNIRHNLDDIDAIIGLTFPMFDHLVKYEKRKLRKN